MRYGRSRFIAAVKDRMWKFLKPTWRLRSGIDVEVRSYAEWVLYSDIFVNREYDSSLARVKDHLVAGGNPAVVLDLGSNVGFFVAKLYDYMHQHAVTNRIDVYGFEANTGVFEQSRLRLDQPIFKDRLNLHRGMVGRRSGNATFSCDSLDHISSRICEDDKTGTEESFLDIEPLIPEHREITLVKCDIEGAEEAFIFSYGELLRRTKYFLVEFHGELCNVEHCREELNRLGFTREAVCFDLNSLSVEFFAATR